MVLVILSDGNTPKEDIGMPNLRLARRALRVAIRAVQQDNNKLAASMFALAARLQTGI